jgi:superfamily II DNA or RNA helicase
MQPSQTSNPAPGSRVVVRGYAWTVLGRTSFAACAAVSLRRRATRPLDATRILITPFDRLVLAERPQRPRLVKPTRLLHELRRLLVDATPAGTLPVRAAREIDILPYQLEPALAAAAGATRVLLADDVGLGKTVQAGLIIAQLDAPARVLVAAPAGLRDQWRRELDRHFGLAAVIADTAWLAQASRDLPRDVSPWVLPGVYIMSLDLLKRAEVLRPMEDVSWDAVVVDEAHNAGPGTDRRAALAAIALRARRVVLLTATPHAGDDEAYQALLDLGADGPHDTPPLIFRRTRASLGGGIPRRSHMLAVRLTTAERRMHRQLATYTRQVAREARRRGDRIARLAALVLRKRALSSAASLAQSVARRLELLSKARSCEMLQLALPLGEEDPLEDGVSDEVLATPGLADAGQEKTALASIIESARQAAVEESKSRRLVRLLSRVNEPAIVFTEYRDTLTRLAGVLEVSGEQPLVLHGGLTPAERSDVQRTFNTHGRVLLATDAASEGLNLHTRCRLVIHYELPWTPARLEQRTGRVDRIGQRRRVHEILLVARDTAERMVLAPLMARAVRARRAMAGASPVLDTLTESQVAAAVLEGEPLPPPPPVGPDVGASLRKEAAAEAERLHLVRRCLATSRGRPGADTSSDLWLCAPRRHRPLHQVNAVYAFEMATADGEVMHSEMLVARQLLRGAVTVRSAADLKGWTDRWRRQTEPAIMRETSNLLRERANAIATGRRFATLAAGTREAAIAAIRPDASRALVQAALFDRRAIRARDARARAARDAVAELENRTAAYPPTLQLTSRLRLVALVLR